MCHVYLMETGGSIVKYVTKFHDIFDPIYISNSRDFCYLVSFLNIRCEGWENLKQGGEVTTIQSKMNR